MLYSNSIRDAFLKVKSALLTNIEYYFIQIGIFFTTQGGNCDLPDTNGCSVTHIMVVYDNIASKCKIFRILN